MRYLQTLNWVLFAAGLTMTVLMGVVSLILLIYREEATDIGSNVPRVLITFAVFCVFTLVSGLSSWSLQRRHGLMWTGQGALAAAMFGLFFYFRNL